MTEAVAAQTTDLRSRASAGLLESFCRDALRGFGADEDTAAAETRAMMHAWRLGIDSHGVRLLEHYVTVIAGGRVNSRPQMRVVRQTGAVATFHADDGHGAQPLTRQWSTPSDHPIQQTVSQTQNFALLAIPLFIMAGNFMNKSGITEELLNLASVIAGRLRGGLAQVSVVLSGLMGGVSGSAIADAAMQSRMLGPEMIARGLSRGFASGCFHSGAFSRRLSRRDWASLFMAPLAKSPSAGFLQRVSCRRSSSGSR